MQKIHASNRTKNTITSSSGFTLMELMVVIGIIGIMSAIAIPALLSPEWRARKAVRELVGDMQMARINAIKQNERWRIEFDPANNSYNVVDSNGDGSDGDGDVWNDKSNGDTEIDGGEKTIKTVRFTDYAEGVEFADGCGGGNTVTYTLTNLTFNPQGTCNGGWAYIQYKTAAYRVGTLSTGVIRTQRCTGGAWQ